MTTKRGFGFHDADFELAQLEERRRNWEREWVEAERAAFNEWCEKQSRIPGSGVYRL